MPCAVEDVFFVLNAEFPELRLVLSDELLDLTSLSTIQLLQAGTLYVGEMFQFRFKFK